MTLPLALAAHMLTGAAEHAEMAAADLARSADRRAGVLPVAGVLLAGVAAALRLAATPYALGALLWPGPAAAPSAHTQAA